MDTHRSLTSALATLKRWTLPILLTLTLGFNTFTLLSLTGCAKQQSSTIAPTRQGSANAFDSTTYDALISLQAAIEQAKVGISNDRKPLLNKVIAYYNTAKDAYDAYHNMAIAGTATPAVQADLQAKMATLQTGVTQLGVK